MGPIDDRAACVIGVAQRTWHPGEGTPEPLEMWAQVAGEAAADTAAPGVLAAADSAQVVYCMSWPYDDPPARLAERLGLRDGHRFYSGIGGTTPQVLVADTADRIGRGELDLALLVGGEALHTVRQHKKRGERMAWSHRRADRAPMPFEAMPPPSELAHEVLQAWLTFALFDVARRARLGTPPEPHRHALGQLFAPMTAIAAANPHAWFPLRRSAAEIVTPTPGNRMVGYPYTKYMVAVMDVDMAGALLVASEAKANELGVPRERRVYLRGSGYVNDPWVVAERADLSRSPGMHEAARLALEAAGVGIDDVALLDLYSCFASSIEFARDALGLRPDDERPVTVTGGLPYAGGPASNYLLHSIATMVERLRAAPGELGLVTGVGMHMTKHVYAVYSTEPAAPRPVDPDAAQHRADEANAPREVVDAYDGDATLVTYSVIHGSDGVASTAVAVLDLPDGRRAYARTSEAAFLADAELSELVGTRVAVTTDGKVNTLHR